MGNSTKPKSRWMLAIIWGFAWAALMTIFVLLLLILVVELLPDSKIIPLGSIGSGFAVGVVLAWATWRVRWFQIVSVILGPLVTLGCVISAADLWVIGELKSHKEILGGLLEQVAAILLVAAGGGLMLLMVIAVILRRAERERAPGGAAQPLAPGPAPI